MAQPLCQPVHSMCVPSGMVSSFSAVSLAEARRRRPPSARTVAPRRVLCVGVTDDVPELDAGALEASEDAALLELAGFDEELAGGVLELAGGVETLCGREDELSSFEHAANSTTAQSAGARSFHTDFFITKHFLSLGDISMFIIRPAATKYFTFRRILHKFHKLRIEKNGEARPPHFMLTPRTAR